MTGSVALDVVIGLVFVFLLYSLLASVIQEIISSWLSLRAADLKEAIERMLDDDTKTKHFSKGFYESPSIKYFAREGEKPSYLTAANFSKVVLDILKGPNPMPGEDFRDRVDASLASGINIKGVSTPINSGGTFVYLQSLWAESQGDVDRFRALIEQWFDDTMDRTSGWYKRKIQKILFFIGLGLAATFNVDSITIAHKLANDPELRKEMVARADKMINDPQVIAHIEKLRQKEKKSPDSLSEDGKKKLAAFDESMRLAEEANKMIKEDIASVNSALGLGYEGIDWGCWTIPRMIVGWILTALAISLGAPFWFDLLNKLMKLRTSVAVASSEKTTTDDAGRTIASRKSGAKG